MSGETARDESAWTIDSLYLHVVTLLGSRDSIMLERDRRYEQRFNDLEKAVLTALVASEKAIIKAETATEKRFEAVNEFRSTLSDQATTFITRAEAEGATGRNTERIQDAVVAIEKCATRAEITTAEARFAERLTDVERKLSSLSGRSSGAGAVWVYLFAGIAAISALVAIYTSLHS